jgi:hypothetical protein
MPQKPKESESRIKRQKIPFFPVRDPVRESGPKSCVPSEIKGGAAYQEPKVLSRGNYFFDLADKKRIEIRAGL